MNEIASLALAAVVAIARGPAAKEPDHLAAIAHDIAAVAASEPNGAFEGPAAKAGLALMLVAIAKHESEFHPKVDSCKRRGDVGKSITIFQLMRGPNWAGNSAEAICADRRLAATLAARLFARPLLRTPRATPQMLANAYASGSPGKSTRAAREICQLWEKLARGAGVEGAVCGARRELTFAAR